MKSHTHRFLLVLAVFLIISGLLACLIPSAIHVHKLDEEGSAMEESLKDLKLTSSAPAETETDTNQTPNDTPDETPAPDMQPATVSQDTVVPTDTGFIPHETPVKSGIHYPGYQKDSSILFPPIRIRMKTARQGNLGRRRRECKPLQMGEFPSATGG